MPSLVEIQYNPYLPQVEILIDGKQPASFSRLIQYTDEDIWNWSDEILDAVYSEIRDDFNLCFTGSDFDAEIMQQICLQDRYCTGFKHRSFIVADSMQSRLGKLNQFIKKAGITVYDKTVIDAYFYLAPSLQRLMEDINTIDINNLFCAVRIHITGAKHVYEDNENSALFIIADSLEQGRIFIEDFNPTLPAYVIIIGNETRVINIAKNGLFIETKEEELFETLFRCFLQRPLVIALRKCVQSIHGSGMIFKELEKITSVNPIVSIAVGSEVETGRSIKISASQEPNVGSFPNLIYKVRNQDIASCDGLNVYGLNEGRSILEVYKQGSSKPFFTKEIKVFKRNRIKRLVFSDDNLLIGIGDDRRIRLEYFPADADNVKDINWKSSDENIVSIDQKGNLTAKGSGICRIICTAENVSSQCTCVVKPYMQELTVDTDEDGCFHLVPMQEITLSYKCVPADCIDRKVTISSSDSDVVNVVNNTLYAKNQGSAYITIKNESGRISRTFNVVVEKHGQTKKKGGFFKRLFS